MADKQEQDKKQDESVIPQKKPDLDMLSKRRLLNAYGEMRSEHAIMKKELAKVTIMLFFYAPQDEYFNKFTDEQRNELTLAAADMFKEPEQSKEKYYCKNGCGAEVPFDGALCGIMNCEKAL